MANLIFHYQKILHKDKEALHEAFSTRSGLLYMVNPVPVEVSAESEEELELSLKAMEVDSIKYIAVKMDDIIPQLERWQDEVDFEYDYIVPAFDDEENIIEDDYLDSQGEVIDLVDFIKRRK